MTINEIHEFINDLIDKEQAGYHTPGQIDNALDRASMWLFNNFLSLYAENQNAQDALAPFKKSVDYTTDSSGVYTISSGESYVRLLSIDAVVNDATYGNRRWDVELVPEDELAQRLNSQLNAPAATSPVGIQTGVGKFKIYPAQVHAGTIRFLRRPAVPVFGYTQSGRTITYVPGTSTDLEWTEPYQNKVILKAIQFLGINLDNEKIVALGDAIENKNA